MKRSKYVLTSKNSVPAVQEDVEEKREKKIEEIYTFDTYGATATAEEVLEAVLSCKTGTKRVLIQCGANWNISCYKFHHMLTTLEMIASEIRKNWEFVLLNVQDPQNYDLLSKLGYPQKYGVPVFVVLDNRGRYLHTQPTAILEKDPFACETDPDPVKFLNFLKMWYAADTVEDPKPTIGPPQRPRFRSIHDDLTDLRNLHKDVGLPVAETPVLLENDE